MNLSKSLEAVKTAQRKSVRAGTNLVTVDGAALVTIMKFVAEKMEPEVPESEIVGSENPVLDRDPMETHDPVREEGLDAPTEEQQPSEAEE